jgi:HPt (histidine-containing phosphotransfer) domain-containing protein
MMIEVTRTALDAVVSPPLVPGDRPIDLVHLSHMTLGDRALERDVLVLFERQIQILMERIETGAGPVAAAAAHTLKGSARGVGAFALARAAAEVEDAAARGDTAGREAGTNHLRGAIRDANVEIAGLLSPA